MKGILQSEVKERLNGLLSPEGTRDTFISSNRNLHGCIEAP